MSKPTAQKAKRYWLTPPDLYARYDAEFHFDFDPCPVTPEGLRVWDGLGEWGSRNWVNPPFRAKDGSPTAFARKAVEQLSKGKLSVLTLPTPSYVNILLEAGAEARSLGRVRWLEVDSKQPMPGPSCITAFILRPKALEISSKEKLAAVRKNVITLCGSVRFRETFDKIAAELCFKGYIVLSLNVWGTEPKTGYIDDNNPAKRILESAHFRKIDLSESILVINEGTYVGKSTAGEIAYARANGKKVYWYNFLDAHYEQDPGKRPQFGESSWKDLINLAEAEAAAPEEAERGKAYTG